MSNSNDNSTGDDHNDELMRYTRLIFNNTPDLISIIDRDHRFRYVNPAYARINGVSEDEIIGKEVRKFVGDGVYETVVRHHIDECFTGNELHYENMFHFPGQDPKMLDIRYFPIREEGTINTIVNVIRDVTALKTISESEMYKQKLRTIVEMAGMVNHEINNPLFTLSGYIELLLQFETDAKKTEYLKTALDSAHRIGNVTRKLTEAATYTVQDYPGGDKIIEIPDNRTNHAG